MSQLEAAPVQTAPRAENPVQLNRTYHLIDIENLAAGQVSPLTVQAVWSTYSRAIEIKPGDAVVVGCGSHTARTVAFAIPASTRLLIGGYGRDAADIALLADLDADFIARRYDTVVIGSADGCFAPAAAELGSRGLTVYGVGRSDRGYSTALRLATSRVLRLRLPEVGRVTGIQDLSLARAMSATFATR